jgi:hypothetical protein
MATASLTSYAGAVKQIYSPDQVEIITFQDNPLLALMAKDTTFDGAAFNEALIYGNPQGRGTTISQAQTTASASTIAGFQLKRVSNYGVASISNELIEASASNKGSLLKALTTEIDGTFRNVSRSLAMQMYGDGTGSLGTVASTASSGTIITMTDVNQITNIDVNQSLDFWTATSSGTLHATATVTSVDYNAGTFTLGTAIAGALTSIASSDVILMTGDLNAALSGLAAWLPLTAPSSGDSFFSVNRSVSPTRLAGVRSKQVGVSIDEAIINGAADLGIQGGASDYCFMDFLNWRNLVKILGPQVRYMDLNVAPKVGFQAVEVIGPKGKIKVIPDRNCPSNLAYLLSMDTWKLRSLGMAPKLLDSDGNRMLREATADNVQVRVGYYAQMGCSAPGHNAVIQLA